MQEGAPVAVRYLQLSTAKVPSPLKLKRIAVTVRREPILENGPFRRVRPVSTHNFPFVMTGGYTASTRTPWSFYTIATILSLQYLQRSAACTPDPAG